MLKYLIFISLIPFALALPSQPPRSYRQVKKDLQLIHEKHPYTLYCNCKFSGKKIDLNSCGYQVHKNHKRAAKIEWEHVVAAHAFGHAFAEWRKGGRKMAMKNVEFQRMHNDMYNLQPEIGELNGLRSNYSMADFAETDLRKGHITFGQCRALIQDRKFEPMDKAKGVVARTYLYMDQTYPGRGVISRKNKKLFEAWDKMFPVSSWECQRAELIKAIQGNENLILKSRCSYSKE